MSIFDGVWGVLKSSFINLGWSSGRSAVEMFVIIFSGDKRVSLRRQIAMCELRLSQFFSYHVVGFLAWM